MIQKHLAAIPALALIAVGVITPLALLLVMSLARREGFEVVIDFRWENFVAILTRESYVAILLRSIAVAGFVALLSVMLAFPVAMFLAFDVSARYKMAWLALITLPFWTSYLLRVFAWKIILGYDGVINGSLIGLGFIDEPLGFLLYNRFAVILTLAHAWAPFAVLPIFVSLDQMDRRLLDVASDLGDPPITRFFRLIVPLSSPGLVGAFLVVFIPTTGDYITPALVGGPTSTMVGNAIFLLFARAHDWPAGAALSVIVMIALSLTAGVLVYIYHRLNRLNRFRPVGTLGT